MRELAARCQHAVLERPQTELRWVILTSLTIMVLRQLILTFVVISSVRKRNLSRSTESCVRGRNVLIV